MSCGTVKSGIELWTFQKNRFWICGIEGPLHEIRKINFLEKEKQKLMSVFLTHMHVEMKVRKGKECR